MFTKQGGKPEEGILLLRLKDRYRIDYYRGTVRGFADLNENVKVTMTRLDPDQMKRWSEQPCLLDEANAAEIAKRLFRQLGFDEQRFDPIEVHRYSWQPSEANRDNVLWLPLFQVTWFQMGTQRDQALPPSVTMDISGTTKKLVYYHDATRDERVTLRASPTPASATQSPANPDAAHKSILRVCEDFFLAVGIRPPGNWQSQLQVTTRPQDFAPTWAAVQNRYVFKLRDTAVYEFSDHDQWLPMLTAEERTADLRALAGLPATVTETQAVQMAAQILAKLGFDKRKLTLSKVERSEASVDDPQHAGTSLPLPTSYRVQWVGKRPFWARNGMPDIIGMEISGAAGNLVHYYHGPNTFRFWPVAWLKWLTVGSMLLVVLLLAMRRLAR
jgi:hypothetical protein